MEFIERLTPLDLLMPRTYVSAAFAFRTGEHDGILESLQRALDSLCIQLPWLTGHLFPSTGSVKKPGLELRWNATDSAPTIVDQGPIELPYQQVAKDNMPPSAIPAHVWPVPMMIDDALFATGAPVLGVSIFRFSDSQGIGLCMSIHHGAVDAASFARIVALWVRDIAGIKPSPLEAGLGRYERLSEALAPHLASASARSLDSLIATHPEHSREPPQLPKEFSPCTTKLFTIPLIQVTSIKKRMQGCGISSFSTNTIVCAVVWCEIARARKQRASKASHQISQLAMAVDGRKRICGEFSTEGEPYIGNAILYSLAQLSYQEVSDATELNNLARVCEAIAESQAPSRIDGSHIAEVCSIVDKVEDYRTVFPGWDLFSSRDLTITSWANYDLYTLDFGPGLGVPDFIRTPYLEADGVVMIMPLRRIPDEVLDVTVMLRKDDMGLLQLNDAFGRLAA